MPSTTANTLRQTSRLLFLLFCYCLLASLLFGCMPKIYQPAPPTIPPQLLNNRYLTADGTMLPLKQWLPTQTPKAVLIAVHGFNDYSGFFQAPGNYFSQQGIICYAYDQRGFGGSPPQGFWSGTTAYSQDLAAFIRLIHNKHPNLPVYVFGESMGAAVVIATMTQTPKPAVAGIILSAPAVWDRESMPWHQQALLWTLAHTLPSLTLTGRGLKIQASDNIPMLRALSNDPLVIKATRVEAMYGLATLMDTAQQQAGQIDSRSLVLYGDHDQLIPKPPVRLFISKLLARQTTAAFYQEGYHMLLRDLNAAIVWEDMLAWINSPSTPLPSKADRYAKQRLRENG